MTYRNSDPPSSCYILPFDRPPQTLLTRLRDWWMDFTGRNTFEDRTQNIVFALSGMRIQLLADVWISAAEALDYIYDGVEDELALAKLLASQGIGREYCPELCRYLNARLLMLLDLETQAEHVH